MGLFLTADWMEGYVCSLDMEGEMDCVVIHLYLNVKTYSPSLPGNIPAVSRVLQTQSRSSVNTDLFVCHAGSCAADRMIFYEYRYGEA